VLREAGAHMGDRLVGPDRGNPRGHFEDPDFVDFHQRALFARGQHVRVTPGFTFAPNATERREAEALVAARSDRPMWGWKDPRTALFLDFWDALVPGAAYVFLYRHPLDVLLSLVRRADVTYLGFVEAVDAWSEYNRQLLAFRRRRPRTLLCHVNGLVADGDAFGRLLRERLQIDLPVSGATIAGLYRADELKAAPVTAADLEAFERLCPEAIALLGALDADADQPDPARHAAEAEPARGGSAPAEHAADLPAAAARRAGLDALVARLVPEAYEALYDGWLTYTGERERAVRYLQDQHRDDLGEIARWRAECAQLREWHEAQTREHRLEVERWEAATAALQAAVRDLEGGKAWLEEQRRADEDGRRWLAERSAAQQAEIERWTAEYAALRDAHAQLEGAVAWLEQQRAALQAEIERWRAAHADAEAWARDREAVAVRLARQLAGGEAP
jgi:exonuclease VII small subunit